MGAVHREGLRKGCGIFRHETGREGAFRRISLPCASIVKAYTFKHVLIGLDLGRPARVIQTRTHDQQQGRPFPDTLIVDLDSRINSDIGHELPFNNSPTQPANHSLLSFDIHLNFELCHLSF